MSKAEKSSEYKGVIALKHIMLYDILHYVNNISALVKASGANGLIEQKYFTVQFVELIVTKTTTALVALHPGFHLKLILPPLELHHALPRANPL